MASVPQDRAYSARVPIVSAATPPLTTSALRLDMPTLLERAGFRVRARRRADCARCTGRSRGTVAFTNEVAFCFRCKWSANLIVIARELGLLATDAEARRQLRAEGRRRARREAPVRAFERWRDLRLRSIADRYHALSSRVALAHRVLLSYPEEELAWDALARWYHAEAKLSRAFDFLMFTKPSEWLERSSTPSEVFLLWKEEARADA